MHGVATKKVCRFQSTSPVRGTTVTLPLLRLLGQISIHVPREGDDGGPPPRNRKGEIFQSTSPVRGTTLAAGDASVLNARISIHVPREGDDYYLFYYYLLWFDFNPRPP